MTYVETINEMKKILDFMDEHINVVGIWKFKEDQTEFQSNTKKLKNLLKNIHY